MWNCFGGEKPSVLVACKFVPFCNVMQSKSCIFTDRNAQLAESCTFTVAMHSLLNHASSLTQCTACWIMHLNWLHCTSCWIMHLYWRNAQLAESCTLTDCNASLLTQCTACLIMHLYWRNAQLAESCIVTDHNAQLAVALIATIGRTSLEGWGRYQLLTCVIINHAPGRDPRVTRTK